MKYAILVFALLAACADPTTAPIPKIYSWQDCQDDLKPAAQEAFEKCLDAVNLYAMAEYPSGERFTPRNCEQYAIALYCVPASPPRCEKEVIEAVNNCDEQHEGERQVLKSAYDKLADQFNSCKAREDELESCAGFSGFFGKCLKKHVAELVEAPDGTPTTDR